MRTVRGHRIKFYTIDFPHSKICMQLAPDLYPDYMLEAGSEEAFQLREQKFKLEHWGSGGRWCDYKLYPAERNRYIHVVLIEPCLWQRRPISNWNSCPEVFHWLTCRVLISLVGNRPDGSLEIDPFWGLETGGDGNTGKCLWLVSDRGEYFQYYSQLESIVYSHVLPVINTGGEMFSESRWIGKRFSSHFLLSSLRLLEWFESIFLYIFWKTLHLLGLYEIFTYPL